jgi:hypothetical protein
MRKASLGPDAPVGSNSRSPAARALATSARAAIAILQLAPSTGRRARRAGATGACDPWVRTRPDLGLAPAPARRKNRFQNRVTSAAGPRPAPARFPSAPWPKLGLCSRLGGRGRPCGHGRPPSIADRLAAYVVRPGVKKAPVFGLGQHERRWARRARPRTLVSGRSRRRGPAEKLMPCPGCSRRAR